MSTNLTSSDRVAGADIFAANPNELRTDILKNAGDFEDTTGSANAYLLSVDAGIVAYSDGDKYRVVANFSNTGAATININSIAVKSIVKPYDAALGANDMTSGQYYEIEYDASLDKFVLITNFIIPTSKAGTGASTTGIYDSTNGPFSVQENIDIDVSPFTVNDIIMVYWNVTVQLTNVNGSVENNRAFGSFVGLVGEAGIEWHSQRNISGAASTGSAFDETGVTNYGDANDDMSSMGKISVNTTPDSETATVTVDAPIWSGSNLRFVVDHTGNSNGTIQFRPTVNVSALAVKIG